MGFLSLYDIIFVREVELALDPIGDSLATLGSCSTCCLGLGSCCSGFVGILANLGNGGFLDRLPFGEIGEFFLDEVKGSILLSCDTQQFLDAFLLGIDALLLRASVSDTCLSGRIATFHACCFGKPILAQTEVVAP